MRSLLLKGITAALFAFALAPMAHAQYRDITLTAHSRPIGGIVVQADSFIYDNTFDYSGFTFVAGGSAATGANTLTRMVMDDITFPTGFADRFITRFDFFVANRNAVAVTARPRMRFWLPDGSNGGPGTYYNNNGLDVSVPPDGVPDDFGFTFNPITFPANSLRGFFTTFDTDPESPDFFPFKVPNGGSFWIGVTFDNNNGGTGATAAQLDNLGVLLFRVPLRGSSADDLFLTTNPGSFFAVSNPPGAIFDFNNSTDPMQPLANIGYGFAIDLTGRTISGNILLEGNPPLVGEPNPVGETLFVEFKVGGVLQFTQRITLGANGVFTTEAPAGNYTVGIKGRKWLKKVVPVDVTAGNVTNVAATLKAGDANDDNTVDIADLLILIGAYNQISPSAGYAETADFNGDGANDITDLLFVIGNYNQLGDS